MAPSVTFTESKKMARVWPARSVTDRKTRISSKKGRYTSS